jgi:uncharacterized integral membrane protein
MAILHRDRTDVDDTVAGASATRPDWSTGASTEATGPQVVRKNSFLQTLATVLATVILVAVVAIAIANTDQVDIDLLFDSVDVPLSALVGSAAFAGFLIGALLGLGRRRRRA